MVAQPGQTFFFKLMNSTTGLKIPDCITVRHVFIMNHPSESSQATLWKSHKIKVPALTTNCE